MRFGMSNLAANAAAAMEQTVFGSSYETDDEYAGEMCNTAFCHCLCETKLPCAPPRRRRGDAAPCPPAPSI